MMLWRIITGLHARILAKGSREEIKLASEAADSAERKTGLTLKRTVVVRFVNPTSYRQSKSLGIAVGTVWEPRLELFVCGCAEPRATACYVVRQPEKARFPVLEHEIAECLSKQHGLRGEGSPHRPIEWRSRFWGWV